MKSIVRSSSSCHKIFIWVKNFRIIIYTYFVFVTKYLIYITFICFVIYLWIILFKLYIKINHCIIIKYIRCIWYRMLSEHELYERFFMNVTWWFNQKLRDIKVNLEYCPPLCKNRREEVNRLRLAHCWFSHHHLMNTDGPRIPTVYVFFALLKQWLWSTFFVECQSLQQKRARYISYDSLNAFSLFTL